MTGNDIKASAQSYCDAGTLIADASAILWINECLLKLGYDARVSEEADITAPDDKTWVALPVDLGAIYSVDKSDGNGFAGKFWIRNGKIRFDMADTFTLFYWKMPAEITSLDDSVAAHELLKSAIALYAASRYKSQDDDENRDALRLMATFVENKNQALHLIDNPVLPAVTAIEAIYTI